MFHITNTRQMQQRREKGVDCDMAPPIWGQFPQHSISLDHCDKRPIYTRRELLSAVKRKLTDRVRTFYRVHDFNHALVFFLFVHSMRLFCNFFFFFFHFLALWFYNYFSCIINFRKRTFNVGFLYINAP